MDPTEYCDRWVDFPKQERGYYTACVSALAKVTGLSRRTVEKWGPEFRGCPDYVKLMLRYRDVLNQIKRSLPLKCSDRISQAQTLSWLKALLGMDAETFCNRWFDLDKLPPEQIEAAWKKRGHRAACVRLLAAVLRVNPITPGKWGARFENMPADHQPTLAYADALRQQIQIAAETQILDLVLANLQKNKENK